MYQLKNQTFLLFSSTFIVLVIHILAFDVFHYPCCEIYTGKWEQYMHFYLKNFQMRMTSQAPHLKGGGNRTCLVLEIQNTSFSLIQMKKRVFFQQHI